MRDLVLVLYERRRFKAGLHLGFYLGGLRLGSERRGCARQMLICHWGLVRGPN